MVASQPNVAGEGAITKHFRRHIEDSGEEFFSRTCKLVAQRAGLQGGLQVLEAGKFCQLGRDGLIQIGAPDRPEVNHTHHCHAPQSVMCIPRIQQQVTCLSLGHAEQSRGEIQPVAL